MSVFLRPATLADRRQMAELAAPGLSDAELAAWMAADANRAAWHLIEDDTGRCLGFQHIGPRKTLPAHTCEIATFLAPMPLPPGAAARLFDATADAARGLGYLWIEAHLVAANTAAETWYQSRGFRLCSSRNHRIVMRFDLD